MLDLISTFNIGCIQFTWVVFNHLGVGAGQWYFIQAADKTVLPNLLQNLLAPPVQYFIIPLLSLQAPAFKPLSGSFLLFKGDPCLIFHSHALPPPKLTFPGGMD